jgi:hypothetical protein
MSEDVPFKSTKITLSDEALEKLAVLKQGGGFHSDSATIEECIRAVYGMFEDTISELERSRKDNAGEVQTMELGRQAEMLRRFLLMINRFGRNIPLNPSK